MLRRRKQRQQQNFTLGGPCDFYKPQGPSCCLSMSAIPPAPAGRQKKRKTAAHSHHAGSMEKEMRVKIHGPGLNAPVAVWQKQAPILDMASVRGKAEKRGKQERPTHRPRPNSGKQEGPYAPRCFRYSPGHRGPLTPEISCRCPAPPQCRTGSRLGCRW